MTSSPAPPSWQGESPSNPPSAWIPHLMVYNVDPALPASSALREHSPIVDNSLHTNNTQTFTTLDREEEKGKRIPTAGFIRPFECNEWEEWGGESVMCTTEGPLGGYGGGDEESWIGHFVHPARLGQDGSRGIGTRVPTRFRGGSRRGTIVSAKGSERFGTFNFDALPTFRVVSFPAVIPAFRRRPRYRTCDASPPLPHDETSLTEAGREGGALRALLVEIPKASIRITQGKCGAARE